ncbi:hypothetical protein P23_0203 [Acinetobacter calcoaceticus]|uniref:hypothetical protein n=1 Tax=Acinetobacter calcoaceticus TaxID=471 RepID=UPI000583DE02|nr:hypothetical protein [Acinetobacter calcoaceticus]GAM29709.1 hypothetical protein P23_0203 [Acinetobacter calcoaceticus]
MDSKIICLIAGSFLLTGCITSKVERLHATTSRLSPEIDKYVSMSNRVIDLNHKSVMKFKKEAFDTNLQDKIRGRKNEELYKSEEIALNTALIHMYSSYNNAELLKQQNIYLSEYFKTLPKLLEKQDIGNNLEGIVNNIDVLNQIIEKNLTIADELRGHLKPNEASLIESTLSNGLSLYQYEKFRHSIDRSYDVILKALRLQKFSIFTGNQILYSFLNQNFNNSRKALVDSYIKQMSDARSLNDSERRKVVYKEDDFNKLIELSQQPYKIKPSDDTKTSNVNLARYRSVAFQQYCSASLLNENNPLLTNIQDKEATFEAYLRPNSESHNLSFSYDIEQFGLKSGEKPVCELIDIIGLLKEKKYSQVESSTLSKDIAQYNKILDFVDSDNQKKQEDK